MNKILEGLIFAIFDQMKGPQVFYSTFPDEKIAKNVALRSCIAISLSKKEFQIAEITIPIFSQENVQTHLAFSLLFQLNHNIQNIDADLASLSWVFKAENETYFYGQIPKMKTIGRKVIPDLQKLLETDFNLNSTEFETNLKQCEEFTSNVPNDAVISKQSTLNWLPSDNQADTTKQICFSLFKSLPAHILHFIFQTAILGEPILLVGSNNEFNIFSSILSLLNFKGVSRNAFYQVEDESILTKDIAGIQEISDMDDKLIDKFSLVFDIKNRKILYKKSSNLYEFSKIWVYNFLLASNLEDFTENYQFYLEDKGLYILLIINSLSKNQDSAKTIAETRKLIIDLKTLMDINDYEFVIEIAIRINPFLEDFIRINL